MVQLTRRNTRRYGGYIVHFGIVLIFIGIGGQAFNQSHEQTMNYKDSFVLGPYRVECLDYSQDSNPNYDTEFAMLNVYRGNRLVTKLSPELRVYAVNGQPSTIVANHSTLLGDLYVIYAGKDPSTGQPVIKAFLNPLVSWIWIGLLVTILGTGIALAPNISASMAAARHPVHVPVEPPVLAGGAGD
jgi:cytochrome c-type biogenesis protein CcmF